mgnify:FL=1
MDMGLRVPLPSVYAMIMRIIFMGTPDFAMPALNALVMAGHEIAAVYCQPPRPAGRGKAPRLSPVQARAEALGLNIRTPVSLRDDEEQARFAGLKPDITVVAAYGLILPQPVLDAPRLGCLNIHASLLPRWRGAAPIQRAILAGDKKTGVTIMRMEAGLDTGPMLADRRTSVNGKTAGALTEELAAIGATLMVEVLGRLPGIIPQPQGEDSVTYAAKIGKAEAHLDFTQGAHQVERAIRAFNPAPGAWCEIMDERVKILSALIVDDAGQPGTVMDNGLTIACGQGAIRPTLVQRPGKAAMESGALLRGWAIRSGTVVR